MPEYVFLHSLVKIHTTFTIRQLKASAAQLAYILPPPPTVVGAFVNPLARILGLSEEVNPKYGTAGSRIMYCALKATVAAAAGLDLYGRSSNATGIGLHAEPSRIMGAPYKTGGAYERALRNPPYLAVNDLLPVQAVGYASAPSASIHLVWLVDLEGLSKNLGVDVAIDELRRAAHSVYRIGSRESLVSVAEAHVLHGEDLEVLPEGSRFESVLYQPARFVEPYTPASKVILYDLNYQETEFLVAAGYGSGSQALLPPVEPAVFVARSGCRIARPREMPELAVAFPREPGRCGP